MADETESGPAGASDSGGHPPGGGGLGSPLQTRAAFVKNWDWQSVVGINRGACQRGRAQHGINSETGSASAQEWEALRSQVLTLGEMLDRLRQFHRRAPFLFFNGNTFATIGRELAFALFSDLVPGRKREVGSAVAHYIAGVLDRGAMVEIVESLSESTKLRAGERVKTLRGTARGVILRVRSDGRVVWQPDGSRSELIALPESLVTARKKGSPDAS
ncbi:MAG TPA: hypothetical protein VKY92_13700 [Verrucomicrobiae bacterium]|nr:hypothetical protein [Verrucomicrobiae bacterium]